mmetsp:Transcript_6025/g.14343  ORF Transcript_6025/g.14343 Transcript_6025/m.14343 type:complete len:373 (-) Transcript_6025:12-1130(-)
MAELGRGVDELELDLLERVAAGLFEERLAQRQNALARADAAALDHDEVLVHVAVVGEAADGGDRLLGEIEVGGGAQLVVALADLVHLLVVLRAVVVAVLTSARHGPLHLRRVPRADARHLAQTAVGLAREARHAPARDHALVALALGHADHVDHLVVREDRVDGHLLLEELDAEVHLIGDAAAVHLDLGDVRFLLADLDLADLRVHEHAHNLAVVLNALQLALDVLSAVRVLGRVLSESLFLRLVPVLVEAALHLLGEVLGPHGGEAAQPVRRAHVADDADHDDGRRLDDGHALDDLLLVQLGAGLVHLAHDVRHAALVAEEGGEVRRLGRVILGECLDAATVAARALLGQEPERTAAGVLELTVRHPCDVV